MNKELKYLLYGSGPDCLNIKRHDIKEAIDNGTMGWRCRPVMQLVEFAIKESVKNESLIAEVSALKYLLQRCEYDKVCLEAVCGVQDFMAKESKHEN